MCKMTNFAKPKQYIETFQFVQVDILKYKRYPSAFRFNEPLTQKKYKYIHYLSQSPITHKSSNFNIAATKKI